MLLKSTSKILHVVESAHFSDLSWLIVAGLQKVSCVPKTKIENGLPRGRAHVFEIYATKIAFTDAADLSQQGNGKSRGTKMLAKILYPFFDGFGDCFFTLICPLLEHGKNSIK